MEFSEFSTEFRKIYSEFCASLTSSTLQNYRNYLLDLTIPVILLDVLETVPADPLEVAEEVPAPAENGRAARKVGRKLGQKNKKRRSVIMKIVRKKKIKIPKSSAEAVPGPENNGEYEVEAIVDDKKEKGKTVYRVRWRGYPSSQDSWLQATDLSCKDLLKRYKKKQEKETKDVFSVENIIDHRRFQGTVYYRIRWQNYGPKDDTWQAKELLNCNDLLKQYHDDLNDTILKREEAKLKAREEAKETNEYEVESIVDKKLVKGKTKYLIHWKGWDSSADTWEPEERLNCHELIRAFNKKTPSKKKSKAKKAKKAYDDSGTEEDNDDDSDYGTHRGKRKGQVSHDEYEVEKVINARINKQGKWDFFVMWKGWGPENNTWEPESHLNCPQIIDQVSFNISDVII